jgi:hypothetical protein
MGVPIPPPKSSPISGSCYYVPPQGATPRNVFIVTYFRRHQCLECRCDTSCFYLLQLCLLCCAHRQRVAGATTMLSNVKICPRRCQPHLVTASIPSVIGEEGSPFATHGLRLERSVAVAVRLQEGGHKEPCPPYLASCNLMP